MVRFYEKLKIKHDEVIHILQKLQSIDPLRNQYYSDYISKLVVKNLTNGVIIKNLDESFNLLQNLKLTMILDPINYSYLKVINLSGNKLKSLKFVVDLVMVEELIISSNLLKSLDGIEVLKHLTILDARDNQIADIECCQSVRNIPAFKTLMLTGNALSDTDIDRLLNDLNKPEFVI